MGRASTTVYWLAGEETCGHCLQPYAFAVERRCTTCDGPACPHCVTVVASPGEVVCIACREASEDEEE
jgi:hypothetical protein